MGQDKKYPTLAEIKQKLILLIEGKLSRKEVSDWAEDWLAKDWGLNIIDIDNPDVLHFLELLSAADLISLDRPYLYYEEDFKSWLEELEKMGTFMRKKWNPTISD